MDPIIVLNPQTFQSHGVWGTKYSIIETPHSTVNNRSLSGFEIYPSAQTLWGKPEPLYSTINDDIVVSYFDGYDINNIQTKPHSIIDQKITSRLQIKLYIPRTKYLKQLCYFRLRNPYEYKDWFYNKPCFQIKDSTRTWNFS